MNIKISINIYKEIYENDTPNNKKLNKNKTIKFYKNIINEIKKSHLLLNNINERSKIDYSEQKVIDLLNKPFSDDIINPRAEPVYISKKEELSPIYDYIKDLRFDLTKGNKQNDRITFPKGTLCSDKRLDLCKQVIGPNGVNDLEKTLKYDSLNENNKIQHLLLGNNIAGQKLGYSVAKRIKDKNSKITTWYIAGNDLNEIGIEPVANALINDMKVEQLWLKRNPLKYEGALKMVDMLKNNTYLKVLDLTNTGLLDKGINIICNAILLNKKSSIERLYLDSNGITIKSIDIISKLICESPKLIELSISSNRIGDEGISKIADNLGNLERLSIDSCAITKKGAKYLCEKLKKNNKLRCLGIGYTKSTAALGELPNVIGNEGAIAFSEMLSVNNILLSIDLTHNKIYQSGMRALEQMAANNKTLLNLNVEQINLPINELTRESIRVSIKRNNSNISDLLKKEYYDKFLYPKHLREVKSVYRIGMEYDD